MEECIICFYEKPIEEYICFGCNHRVCSTCYPLMRNVCPVCRFKDAELLQIEIVTPIVSINNQPPYNITRIIGTTLCATLCIFMIYLIIVIPVQRSIA